MKMRSRGRGVKHRPTICECDASQASPDYMTRATSQALPDPEHRSFECVKRFLCLASKRAPITALPDPEHRSFECVKRFLCLAYIREAVTAS